MFPNLRCLRVEYLKKSFSPNFRNPHCPNYTSDPEYPLRGG